MTRSRDLANYVSTGVTAAELDQLDTTSGTPGSGNFLRGDKTWAAAGGGKLLQVGFDTYSTEPDKSNSVFEAIDSTNFQVTMTGVASSSSKFFITVTLSGIDAADWIYMDIYREITGGATTVNISGNAPGITMLIHSYLNDSPCSYSWLDSPSGLSAGSVIKYAPAARTDAGGSRDYNINDSGAISSITVFEISS
tara:strand:+ start:417 stop:1001 length:585 start_codon:yes stop_codon:yes gene_type:complete